MEYVLHVLYLMVIFVFIEGIPIQRRIPRVRQHFTDLVIGEACHVPDSNVDKMLMSVGIESKSIHASMDDKMHNRPVTQCHSPWYYPGARKDYSAALIVKAYCMLSYDTLKDACKVPLKVKQEAISVPKSASLKTICEVLSSWVAKDYESVVEAKWFGSYCHQTCTDKVASNAGLATEQCYALYYGRMVLYEMQEINENPDNAGVARSVGEASGTATHLGQTWKPGAAAAGTAAPDGHASSEVKPASPAPSSTLLIPTAPAAGEPTGDESGYLHAQWRGDGHAAAAAAAGMASSGDTAASGSGGSGPATSGPVSSGPAASGSGGSGPATSGPVSSGPAASGSGSSGPAASGSGGSGPAASGSGGSGPATSGPVSSGGFGPGEAAAPEDAPTLVDQLPEVSTHGTQQPPSAGSSTTGATLRPSAETKPVSTTAATGAASLVDAEATNRTVSEQYNTTATDAAQGGAMVGSATPAAAAAGVAPAGGADGAGAGAGAANGTTRSTATGAVPAQAGEMPPPAIVSSSSAAPPAAAAAASVFDRPEPADHSLQTAVGLPQSADSSAQSAGSPGQSAGSLAQSAVSPAQSAGSPAQSAGAPAQSAGFPAQSAGFPAQSADSTAQSAGAPAQSAGFPAQSAGFPAQSAGAPAQSAGFPAQSAGFPAQSAGFPAQSADSTAQSAGAPAQSAGFPAQSAGAPAQSAGFPAQSAGFPAQSAGFPAQSAGAPAQSAGAPAQSAGFPVQSAGSPAHSAGAPAQSAGFPAQSAGSEAEVAPHVSAGASQAPSGLQPPGDQPGVGPFVPLPAQGGSDSNFFAYFLTAVVLCIIFYLMFHNKRRIMALIIEGRSPSGRRRPHSSQYRKLDNSLEEAISSQKRQEITSNIIY